MTPAPQALPIRFPCWVRAVYSWGGETKRDLGFMEGDLIECLNAGDGAWWTGRLRRDPRMVGSFPSNFVELLDESYQPPSRCASPLPPPEPSPNPSKSDTKKSFRKPFQALKEARSPNPEAEARHRKHNSTNLLNSPSLRQDRRPFSSMSKRPATSHAGSRQPSDRPMSMMHSPNLQYKPHSRAVSPALMHYSRPESPVRAAVPNPYARAPSPAHAMHFGSTPPSPQRHYNMDVPPPAPPPHRYGGSRAPSPMPIDAGMTVGQELDVAPEISDHKNTPSPFSMHFNDIMEQFQDMTVHGSEHFEDQPESHPQSIWGPEDFDKMYGSPNHQRPHTSMVALSHGDSGYSTGFDVDSDSYKGDETREVDDYKSTMTRRLQELHDNGWGQTQPEDNRPPIPAKDSHYNLREKAMRPLSALGSIRGSTKLKKQKSNYELGNTVNRTMTLKSTMTSTTNSSNSTNRSLMSGESMGAFSATSAGSFYRRKFGPGKLSRPASSIDFAKDRDDAASLRAGAQTPLSSITYHSSHNSNLQGPPSPAPSVGLHGGLVTPTLKKSGLLRRLVESARASAATARSTITSASNSRPGSPTKMAKHMPGIAGGTALSPSRPQSSAASRDYDWVAVRRDAYRSNSLSRNEKQDRTERCQMLDIPVLAPVEELVSMVQGNEGADCRPVASPTDFTSASCNLPLVDRSARFVANLPPTITPVSLVQGYLCRPYRSDVQRLRAIFTWVSERICWEDDFEGEISVRRLLDLKRGCSEEIALLVVEMCSAVGIHAEAVGGHLKMPGNLIESELSPRPNHWWNAVIADGEWRIMDCSLANPTNPRRAQFSSAGSQTADSWWFLAQPVQACYTHIPSIPQQQHLVPPIPTEILMSLPCACPAYFKNGLEVCDFDTSMLHLENLELAHIHIYVPEDVECIAEVEVRAFARDMDGDLFESGDVARKPCLSQAEWSNGRKRFIIKALLPGDEGIGVLKVYAGKRGLMHSIKSNPHSLAMALPIHHHGQNPPYVFLTRHPTPHAQRHDLYVSQPQCGRLAANNTFVFAIRQHPSSLTRTSPQLAGSTSGRMSPNPLMRPASAMSMASVSASGSNYSAPSNTSSGSGSGIGVIKPAKLAVQTPSGKIIRLTRKTDNHSISGTREGISSADGTEWETVIKVGERGTWRGLVLADRSLRWCVFAEWECI